MRAKDVIGKKVIDTNGTAVGEVEDVEFDWESKAVTGLVIGGKGEMAEKLFGRLGARSTPDVAVPVAEVMGMGEVVIIKAG